MEDERKIFGLVLEIPTTMYAYQELVTDQEAMMQERILHDIAAAGYTPIGKFTQSREFLRYVKVHHHKHGWQMEPRTATQETAETVRLRAELAAKKGPAT